VLTDIRALADQFLIAFPNINTGHQKKKNVVDGWADYEGVVSRFIDQENTVKEEVPAEEEIIIPDTLSSRVGMDA